LRLTGSEQTFFIGSTERMRIDSSGNVGIGTSSPSQRLDLGSGNLALGSSIFTGSGVSTADVALELGTLRTGSGNAYIDLHAVAGTDYSARLARLTGANGALQISNNGTGDLRIRQENAAPIIFDTSASEKMRIDSAGNVGIGTSSPAGKVGVERSSGSAGWAYHAKTTGVSNDSGVFMTASNNFELVLRDSANKLTYLTNNGNNLAMFVDGTERARIDSSGNVGIGTSSPGDKLEIGGAGAGIILASPNGTRYRITVSNLGVLTVAAV
jgi:hypothetical protein